MKRLLLLSAVLVAGCAVGPDYRRPEIALQDRFGDADAQAIGAVATQTWWRSYDEAVLTELVTRGLGRSLDVQSATEAIRQARAQLRATGVNAALDGSGALSSLRTGGDAIDGTTTVDTAEFGASFVIDLFGGIRRGRESAIASLSAARADLETVRLAWLAELLGAYADARFYQETLALTRLAIDTREETVEITRDQFDAGAATEYELLAAQALLSNARADLPLYAALFDANVFAIAALLNEPATPLMSRMQEGAPQLRAPEGGLTGVPADLLRNRPDVRSAEAELAAAVAEVGVAQAALYPSLTLFGTVGRTDAVDAWQFGPQLSLPILDQGLLRAERDAQVSLAKRFEIAWRASVVQAVQDVQVARSNLVRNRRRATLLGQAASEYGRALSLAQENYRNGAITLLDLLETDRNTATARIAAASAVNDAAQAWATLKIATGAGAAATGGEE